MPVTPVSSGENPLRAIALKVASVAVFVAMSGLIKFAGDVPAGQIVFFRSLFAIPPILLLLAWRRELRGSLRTEYPWGHILRGLIGVTSMGCGFFALTRLPLPDAITLNYAQPLLIVVFSALFLGETIRLYRWSAVAVGLVGVLIVSWPQLTLFSGSGEAGLQPQTIGAIAALTGASMSAVAALLVRRLVQTERSATIVIWFSLTASSVALLTLPFGWQWLLWWQALALVCAGICGGIGQIMMTEAYRYAEVSVVAPFEYTSLILGIAVGYLVFGDLPTVYTIVGGVIVIAAGIFIIWREHQLGLERGKARKVAPTQ